MIYIIFYFCLFILGLQISILSIQIFLLSTLYISINMGLKIDRVFLK